MAIRNRLVAFIKGEVTKQWLLRRLFPIIFAIIITTAMVSNLLFPTAYDWRYMVISSLMSSTENPQGFMYLSAGVAATGILLIPLIGYLFRRLKLICRWTTSAGIAFLILGIVGMVLTGMIYDSPSLPPQRTRQPPHAAPIDSI